MNKQKVSLAALGLVCGLAFFLTTSPAFALPQYCWAECSCSSSCSASCTLDGPYPFTAFGEGGGGEAITYEVITCGEYGLCNGSPSCPSCGNLSCTNNIYGTTGNDTLNGTSERDCIYADSGNDTIDGNAGDDRIYGSYGTDTAYGDSGNDCLWGESYSDHLDGQSGYDFADGGSGSDTCYAEVKVNCP